MADINKGSSENSVPKCCEDCGAGSFHGSQYYYCYYDKPVKGNDRLSECTDIGLNGNKAL